MFTRNPALAGHAVLMNEAGNPSSGGTGGTGGQGAQNTPPTNPILNMPDELIPEAWKDHVRDLRREHKKLRQEMSDIEASYAKRLEAEVSKVRTEYEGKIQSLTDSGREALLRAELKAHALKEGIVDLDALKLADLSKVKINEQGVVEGAEELFKSLKESKPYLFGKTQNTSNPNSPPSSNPPAPLNAKEIKDPAQYEAAKSSFLATHGR